jgi:hypothetical protein
MEMCAVVVQVKVSFVTVVFNAVVPVAVQNSVPVALLSRIFALGNTVPTLAVFLIHRLKLRTEPLGITPAVLGTPDWVSNSLMTYSPAALFVKVVVNAVDVASGPATNNLSNAVLIVEASLCK